MSQKNINEPPQGHSAGVASSGYASPSIHSEEHNNSGSEKLISRNGG
jgi:hypothetical protein